MPILTYLTSLYHQMCIVHTGLLVRDIAITARLILACYHLLPAHVAGIGCFQPMGSITVGRLVHIVQPFRCWSMFMGTCFLIGTQGTFADVLIVFTKSPFAILTVFFARVRTDVATNRASIRRFNGMLTVHHSSSIFGATVVLMRFCESIFILCLLTGCASIFLSYLMVSVLLVFTCRAYFGKGMRSCFFRTTRCTGSCFLVIILVRPLTPRMVVGYSLIIRTVSRPTRIGSRLFGRLVLPCFLIATYATLTDIQTFFIKQPTSKLALFRFFFFSDIFTVLAFPRCGNGVCTVFIGFSTFFAIAILVG